MSDPLCRSVRTGLCAVLCAGLAACSSFGEASLRMASVVTPYQIDVVQGNFVSSEQVALLKPGMGRQAVRDLLGTPLLQSVFHADRWDYVFTFKRKGQEPQLRKVTAFFKSGLLERFDADVVPSEAEFVAMRQTRDKTLAKPVLLLPAIQVNIRAGRFPPAEANGVRFLRIPVTIRDEEAAD